MWRICALAGIIASIYLNNQYIGKAEYSSDKQEWSRSMTKLGDAVVELKFALAANVEQRAIINDHESRIRVLEKFAHPAIKPSQ